MPREPESLNRGRVQLVGGDRRTVTRPADSRDLAGFVSRSFKPQHGPRIALDLHGRVALVNSDGTSPLAQLRPYGANSRTRSTCR